MRVLHAETAGSGYAAPESAANELYFIAIQYLYGEVWNRPGPTLRQRMICSISCFTALQLHSQQRKWFASAQKSVGLTRIEILEIIAQTAHYSGFPSALNALVIADEVLI
jgi:4-carboxymuconolactone decarboxylase